MTGLHIGPQQDDNDHDHEDSEDHDVFQLLVGKD